MSTEQLPVVVIGGGPGGAAAAKVLADEGHDVLVLERSTFPRFHIGESMITFSQEVLERLGVAEELERAGFKKKGGGIARIGHHPDKSGYWQCIQHFWKVPGSVREGRRWAYQVERAQFDKWLLDKAQASGARVEFGAKVTGFSEQMGNTPAKVTWTGEDGNEHVTDAAFVIDASCRHAFLSRKLGHFVPEDRYMTSSVFGHFEGITWPEQPTKLGDDDGYFNLFFLEDGWIWFIPLAGGKTSVGVVMNKHQTKDWDRDPQKVLDGVIGRFQYLRDRFGPDAKQVGPIRVLKNLPYYAKQNAGPGWALCGDAAMFVDPIHSSGIHLALKSGMLLGDAVHAQLRGKDASAVDGYSKWLKAYHHAVRTNVSIYYRVIRYRWLMRLFVLGTGPLSNHWGGPILRRVSAWSFGHYDKFHWAMYLFWAAAYVGMAVFNTLHTVTRIPRWGRYGMAAPIKPFSLPRKDLEQAAPAEPAMLDSTAIDSHIEPALIVDDLSAAPSMDAARQAA